MADDYSSVQRGKLSLKADGLFGGGANKGGGNKKRAREGASEEPARSNSAKGSADSVRGAAAPSVSGSSDVDSGLTPAQKRFKEAQLARERQVMRELVKKTHRQRVEEFNQKIAKLTEHNDIPRISAAGNG
ncbi:hypothetical protein JKP88DRAFT_317095 [Tribonema minus]|uniref:DUF1754-domain-containing protein n=1 Tax=Tribonema minus TaxID=303371 RepID=A0A835YYZ7_9STRA|nr:hypothetical protein JKP88DRAFT_317095 [Tribonema minus]